MSNPKTWRPNNNFICSNYTVYQLWNSTLTGNCLLFDSLLHTENQLEKQQLSNLIWRKKTTTFTYGLANCWIANFSVHSCKLYSNIPWNSMMHEWKIEVTNLWKTNVLKYSLAWHNLLFNLKNGTFLAVNMHVEK